MSNSTQHEPEPVVHVSYLAGYIILSYVISAMGCATTLELLHRRTSRSGLYNWFVIYPPMILYIPSKTMTSYLLY